MRVLVPVVLVPVVLASAVAVAVPSRVQAQSGAVDQLARAGLTPLRREAYTDARLDAQQPGPRGPIEPLTAA
jgi:hypothetical protein